MNAFIDEHRARCGVEPICSALQVSHHRLLEPIGYIPPAEAEANYWRQQDQASTTTKLAQSAALQEG